MQAQKPRRDLLLEVPANDNNGAQSRSQLDAETRRRFARALAELLAERILREHGQTQ